ncbi:MAG: tetratricopeptide repeat protein [Nanoarchaeota archaeon]
MTCGKGDFMDETTEIARLVQTLTGLDNKEGYKLSHQNAQKKMNESVKKVVSFGDKSIPHLVPLLENEETWSCMFALQILKEINSEKSVPYLIAFIKKTEDSDYGENCDDAVHALHAIGSPAIPELMAHVKRDFANKEYHDYIVDALTGIQHPDVYSFMTSMVKEYLADAESYDDWLPIEFFTYNFSEQGNKEVLPLLRKVLELDFLSETQREEIESTIQQIEDPERFQQEIDKLSEEWKVKEKKENLDINEKEYLEKAIDCESRKEYKVALELLDDILAVNPKSYHALFLMARVKRKIGEPNYILIDAAKREAKKQGASNDVIDLINKEFIEIQETHRDKGLAVDENLQLQFKCDDCQKKQNLNPGRIMEIEDEDVYSFENEIRCLQCGSNNLTLTYEGEHRLNIQRVRTVIGMATGFVMAKNKVMFENKEMKYSKMYDYVQKRIQEEPANGELFLRAGNVARKRNHYQEAIRYYKQSLELDPSLIAVYVNLVEIYAYRHSYYHIAGARDETINYLKKMRQLYDRKIYNSVTADKQPFLQFIREMELEFGISDQFTTLDTDKMRSVIKQSAIEVTEATKEIQEGLRHTSKEGMKLLEENRGMVVIQNYHVHDRRQNKSRKLSLSSIISIDTSKGCVCGSGKTITECCYDSIIQRQPFVLNNDGDTYSVFEAFDKTYMTNDEFKATIKTFEEDPRFFIEEENKHDVFYSFFGSSFLSDKKLGMLVFGTAEIRKQAGMCLIKLSAMSEKRYNSLLSAIKEHVDVEEID